MALPVNGLHSTAFLLVTLLCSAVAPAGTDSDASNIYQQHCASCHGQNLQGASAAALSDGEWHYGSTPSGIQSVIKNGIPNTEMPAWASVLSDKQVHDLTAFILEHKDTKPNKETVPASTDKHFSVAAKGKRFNSAGHAFYLQQLAQGDGLLWGMDFLPDGSVLVTQRNGVLWHFNGKQRKQINGIPDVVHKGQGGLLDVAVHPDYATNKNKRWIYLSYSARAASSQSANKGSMTKVVRGQIENGKWQNQETIFEVAPALLAKANHHFGSRFVIEDGYLYFAIGDRGQKEASQDLSRPNGKIFRLHDDGRIPSDNPFIKNKKAMPEIWSYGHRNPQGLVLDKTTGVIWASEHGPKGGDEINIIRKGRNYGWPKITYGINYIGTPITDKTALPGMEQPELYWVPSIAVAGIDIYTGTQFPKWKGKLIAGGMRSEQLHILTLRKSIQEDKKNVTDDVTIFKNEGRIRDVSTAPDGSIYLLLNDKGDPGRLMRLTTDD